MTTDDLAARLKGNKRTFVVHSKSGPYAAVAAMSKTLGRSREFGPFFRFSTELLPPAAPTNFPGGSTDGELRVDFKGDWAQFLREKGLPGCGLKFDDARTLNENTMRYLNAHHRRIPKRKPRAVHESRELSVPPEYAEDYQNLKRVISAGKSLKPYLGRDIPHKGRPDRNDPLLNAWGIQHLHFRAKGTGHILLARITDDDVFVIQALPHVPDSFVDAQLLEILHNNWPAEIAAGKLHGIAGEVVSPERRLALRQNHANFITTMADGTVYLSPGGGLMASGDCGDDRINSDKISSELECWEKVVKASDLNIRAGLNWGENQDLVIRMAFDDRDCCFYEPTTRTRIALNLPGPA
jgi:hypothetical protein